MVDIPIGKVKAGTVLDRESVRNIIYNFLNKIGETEKMDFGEISVTYSVVFRNGKAEYLKCKDPFEHSVKIS